MHMHWVGHSSMADSARGETIPDKSGGVVRPGGFADRTFEGKKKGKGKGAMEAKAARKATIGAVSSLTRRDEKLCGASSSKRGCMRNPNDCPQHALHRCGVITKTDGTVCYSTTHGASNPTE